MNAELSHHLGYAKGQAEGRGSGNNRNGKSRKKVQGDFGPVEIAVPRDRNGSFAPQILPKHEHRWTGFDDKIISMYARGMSTRDIEAHLREIYGVEVSATLISQVTEEVMDEVRLWQSRPPEPLYTIVYLDALVVKMRHEGRVENRAVFVAIGVTPEGSKEVLGLWTGATEGAKLSLQILTEIRNRGVQDTLIACVDGLKGFPMRLHGVPAHRSAALHCAHGAQQLGVRELKERKAVADDLRSLPSADGGSGHGGTGQLRGALEQQGCHHGKLWRRHWAGIKSAVCLPRRDPASDLHDQCRGVLVHNVAKGD